MSTGPPDAPRLWVFDFDGTLSPIVADRAAARLHPASLALLRDLARDRRNRVAVLSTRTLGDLASRVPVPGVILGGSSGLEWRVAGGRRILAGEATRRKLENVRALALPLLERLGAIPGVEIEDKHWSAAVHYRRVAPETMPTLVPLFEELEGCPGIRVYSGPMAAEVQFLPAVNKALGVRLLCRFLGFDAGRGRLFYAGDDENDAAAMRWVLSRNGTVFAVGKLVRVPGALAVSGPAALARAVRAQIGGPGDAPDAGDGRESAG